MIDIWQYYKHILDSEYVRVLNMLGFWIKFFIMEISEGSEYASSSEYASVKKDSLENCPTYSSGSQYARAWIYIGHGYVKVHRILCKLILKSRRILWLEFWIC